MDRRLLALRPASKDRVGKFRTGGFTANLQTHSIAVPFGVNLSFTVSGDTLTYGVVTSITRAQISSAFASFTQTDPLGSAAGHAGSTRQWRHGCNGYGHSSDAWTNTDHWYTNHDNAYSQSPSVYDAYAKFFHTGTVAGVTIFGMNSGGKFGMAYGFSLDENPNVGSTSEGIPPSGWPGSLNVPAKTNYNVNSQTVTLTIGPWK